MNLPLNITLPKKRNTNIFDLYILLHYKSERYSLLSCFDYFHKGWSHLDKNSATTIGASKKLPWHIYIEFYLSSTLIANICHLPAFTVKTLIKMTIHKSHLHDNIYLKFKKLSMQLIISKCN